MEQEDSASRIESLEPRDCAVGRNWRGLFLSKRVAGKEYDHSRLPYSARLMARMISATERTPVSRMILATRANRISRNMEVLDLAFLKRFDRSEAMEPFDGLRAGSWNVWNSLRF